MFHCAILALKPLSLDICNAAHTRKTPPSGLVCKNLLPPLNLNDWPHIPIGLRRDANNKNTNLAFCSAGRSYLAPRC
jgi:hypothetical protein